MEGDFALQDLNDALHLDLPTDTAATIGGFIMAKLGHVPHQGDVVRFREGTAEVRTMAGRRVAEVVVRLDPLQD